MGTRSDLAFIAEISGERVGAAWYRLFEANEKSYGFIAANIPEVTIGVEPTHRRLGVGTKLLNALADSARKEGYSMLSLSVEENNPALNLYERVGFERRSLSDGAWTLVLPTSLAAG